MIGYEKKGLYFYKPFFQLDYQDSNLDKQNQNLLCYHYTIVQSLCAFLEKRCKGSGFIYFLQIFFRLFLIFLCFFLTLSKIILKIKENEKTNHLYGLWYGNFSRPGNNTAMVT